MILPRHARFADRRDAGAQLAKALARYDSEDAIVYAVPRGGVVVADEVARALELPLSLVVARKVGHPENEERAVCATTESGELVCDEEESSALDAAWLQAAGRRAQAEAILRRVRYGAHRLVASGKIAIIIDDGIATGLTVRAAIRSLRREMPSEIVVAAPVAPRAVVEDLVGAADDVVVLETGEPFLGAVGAYYDAFPQVGDEEIAAVMREAARRELA